MGITSTSDGGGYWLTASDGGVFAYGDAAFHGSAATIRLNNPIVGIAATPTGGGYWLVGSDGGVFSYGDAAFHGSTGSMRLNQPIVGMAGTHSGGGYWLVASDGGIFSFGDAAFHGSTGSMRLNRPIIDMAGTGSDGGYWLVASDGGVFSFGDAGFAGSMAGSGATVVGIATAGPHSYWLTGSDGSARLFGGPGPPSPATVVHAPTLGVLGADLNFLGGDTQAGLRYGLINVRWDLWEPSPGQMSQAFVAQVQGAVAQYQAAGWTIAVDIGLQTPPHWVLGLPGGELQDQYGNLSGSADYVYSAAVRNAAGGYISSIVAALPGVAAYRVGLSPKGEMLYPEAAGDQWWAFDPLAQGSAGGLPPTVPPTPMPGWVPGAPTYLGAAVTPAMAQTWYSWYLMALTDAHRWEIDAYRSAGFVGQLQLVMPGLGALPDVYTQRVNDLLAPDALDPAHTMNTGAVWWAALDTLPLAGTAVDISSVGDTSGSPGGNVCQPGDGAVNYQAAPSTIGTWSDTRWLTYLATRHGLPVMGENSGNTPAANLPQLMDLVGACHLQRLQWAWDWSLNGNGPSATLSQVVGALPLATIAAGG